MRPIDRFTRDEASAKVWWPFALLLIVLFVLTFPGQNLAVQDARDAAARRALLTVSESIVPALQTTDLSRPVPPAAAQAPAQTIREQALSDPGVETVRIWATDGRLLLSTDPRDPVGSAEFLNDAQLVDAADDPGAPVSLLSRITWSDTPGPPMFDTYVAFDWQGGSAIAELEVPDARLLADVHERWLGYRIASGVAALVVLGLALLSMRAPKAPIGAGVSFYPESLPEGFVLMHRDDESQLRNAGAFAKERVGKLEERLRESEEARLEVEGELQRAKSSLASAAPRRVPRLEPVAAPPRPPLAVVPPPRPEPVVVIAEPEPQPEPQPEPEVVVLGEAEPVVALPEAAGAAEDLWVVRAEAPPAEAPPAGAPPAEAPAASHEPSSHDETAVDVLNRLVEPVGAHVGPEGTDTSEIRARLARTAALKKPGSRHQERLREPDAP